MKSGIFFKIVFVTMFFVFLVSCVGYTRHPNEEKKINIVFRYDDYSALSSTDTELRIIDLFRQYEASITFGVIPSVCAGRMLDPSSQDLISLTSEKRDILKTEFDNGILDIALHGYSHQTINSEYPTEFSGCDYNSQVESLSKGKEFLENIIDAPITTFIPPWNSYDPNTILILEELGFSTLSADMGGAASEDSTLFFVPATTDLPHLQDAVKVARDSSDTQPVIVVLFHSYDFIEASKERGNITFQEFSDLLNWLKSQNDVRLLSVSQATEMINDLSANRYWLNRRNCLLLFQFLPSPLQGEECKTQYPEPSTLNTFIKIGGFYFMIFSLGAVFSFIIGILVFPKSEIIKYISTFGSILLSLIVLIYSFYNLQVYLRGMLVSSIIVGSSLGLCICFLYLNKKTPRFSD